MKSAKNILSILFVALMLGSTIGMAFAQDGFTNTGNDRKGKYVYRKNCRSCHDGSSAKALSPNSKTQAQWQRTFEKYDRLKCADQWKKQSPEELNDIYTYLYNHGYDSPQPATCK